MNRASLIVVLAEDGRHQGFIRRCLYRLGYENRLIRFAPLPGSRGCGEQWVREHFAAAVKEYRLRCARARTALIVAIDADTGEVDRRLRQLGEALAYAELSARSDDETIVYLIPKRSIETWILCLSGDPVDEKRDYSRESGIEERIAPAAAKFFEWSRPNASPPEHCVSSLRAAIPEARRLE